MLRYNYKTPMGKMIIEQTNMLTGEKMRFPILICEANCLAAFISIGKDENGKLMNAHMGEVKRLARPKTKKQEKAAQLAAAA